MRCGILLLCLASCASELAPVDPSLLACFSDTPEAPDLLPCPETHRCAAPRCVPRLGCMREGTDLPGCDPRQDCELRGQDCQRCLAELGPEVAAVRCEPGVHTATSTAPGEGCACPDGLYCGAFAAGPAGVYPLYLLPAGRSLPVGQLGITAEHAERRRCVRACSSEVDCPANHTCRPAAVVVDALLAAPATSRLSLGACYPNRLSGSSTVTPPAQPDPLACARHEDCAERATQEPCRQRVIEVKDHPAVPLREAWGLRRALVGQCSSEVSSGLRSADQSCMDAVDCKSGICVDGLCGRPCDPPAEEPCPSNRGCLDTRVERRLPDGSELIERVYLCSGRS